MKTWVIVFLMFAASSASANPMGDTRPLPRPQGLGNATCSKCAEYESLEKQLLSIDYLNRTERTKGYVLVVKALDLRDKDAKRFTSAKADAREFAAFVRMAAVAGIYDTESSLADTVADLTFTSAGLRAIYLRTLTTPPVERCRRESFQAAVEEHSCLNALPTSHSDAAEAACVHNPPQPLDECLSGSPRASLTPEREFSTAAR